MRAISQETKITIGVAGVLATGLFYLASLDARTTAASVMANKNETRIEGLEDKVEKILINSERPNTKLDMLLEKSKRQ